MVRQLTTETPIKRVGISDVAPRPATAVDKRDRALYVPIFDDPGLFELAANRLPPATD